MDEIVIRAIARWPDVPAVYGWLRLDRRGNWRVKARAPRDGVPVFERISNPAVIEFIDRNYARDATGRWYFQNGPQRVFVALDYTPWVYRLDDAAEGFVAHAGSAPRAPVAAFLDDAGALLLQTDLGIGVLLDRDLQAVLDHLTDSRERGAEQLVDELAQGAEVKARLFGSALRIASIRAADVAARFGFVPAPVPRPGEPGCQPGKSGEAGNM
jgi:hypothetical protein